MTLRQYISKAIYPITMAVGKLFGAKSTIASNNEMVRPVQSIYDLKFMDNGGREIVLRVFKGKRVMIVNTASDCGYTPQLTELEQLHKNYRETLVIIGFPSNDFKEQEKGSDKDIEQFCKINYGVSFLMAKKSVVSAGFPQNEVFKWLTHSAQNGWNNQLPEWNFSKFLLNEQGVLTHYFGPSISPVSRRVTDNL